MLKPSLIVHGGAGHYSLGTLESSKNGCAAAARIGLELLHQGASAEDAVEMAVRALEDDPIFNAGTGSVLNSEGHVEMDACLMSGSSKAGAVGAVTGVKNPIRVARLVMERSPHVFLVGEGARRFALAQGIHSCPEEALITERQREHWATLSSKKTYGTSDFVGPEAALSCGPGKIWGTVGAVAVDRTGHVAAGTSTGGITNKLPGRVGDTPIPGAGTYADDGAGAASATGVGEAILRVCLTKTAVDLLAQGHSPMQAAGEAISRLAQRTGSHAGVIVVDVKGRVGYAFNTPHMSRGWGTAGDAVQAGIDPEQLSAPPGR